MPAVELPNGGSAILFTKDEISERTNRLINDAFMRASAQGAQLVSKGFDANKPETWHIYTDLAPEERADLDHYQSVLIVGMVKQWSLGELPTLDSVLELPKKTYEMLAKACSDEFNKEDLDFSPDGAIDPKVGTAN